MTHRHISMAGALGRALRVLGLRGDNPVWTWRGGIFRHYEIGELVIDESTARRALDLDLVVNPAGVRPLAWTCIDRLSARGVAAARLAAEDANTMIRLDDIEAAVREAALR